MYLLGAEKNTIVKAGLGSAKLWVPKKAAGAVWSSRELTKCPGNDSWHEAFHFRKPKNTVHTIKTLISPVTCPAESIVLTVARLKCYKRHSPVTQEEKLEKPEVEGALGIHLMPQG